MLQLALDYFSLPPAIAMAVKVAPFVDVIEIGTPLCKAAGIEAVRAIREVCPDNLILADLNHPLAGQRLHFEVEVVEVREARAEELEALKEHAGCAHESCGCCGTSCD